jgi:hypothetical protein
MHFIRNWKYQALPLSQEQTTTTPPLPPSSCKPSRRAPIIQKLIIILPSTITLTAIIFTILFFTLPPSTHNKPLPRLTCGTNLTTAKANNCTFDILTMSWLPPSCPLDEATSFLDYDTFSYYRHKNATSPMDITELSELGHGLWFAKQKEHMAHCAFMLLRLHAVLERGDRIDGLTGSLMHSRHCVMMLLEASKWDPENEVVNTPGTVAFGVC